MIEPSKKVEVLLLKTYKLVKKINKLQNFGNTFFKDFVKTERNHDFINKNFFLNDDSK